MQTDKKASLCGIKGLGKTSVVYKFIEENAAVYQHIIFIRADRLGFISNLDEACKQMFLEFGEGDTEESRIIKFAGKIQELCAKVENGKFVLLIFDNVDEVGRVAKFVPAFERLHLLLTSNFEAIHDIGHCVSIDNLSDFEAKLLLYVKAKNSDVENLDNVSDEEQATMLEIAALLGHHPFALSVAGLFIRDKRKTFAQYLNRLQQSTGRILHDESGVDAYDHASIYTAFEIPFNEIREVKDDSENEKTLTEISRKCLKIAALMSADNMPEEVFTQSASKIFPHYAEFIADDDNWDNVYERLALYGFFERNQYLATFSVHRLFRLFLTDKLKNEVEAIIETLAQVLADNFKFFDFTNQAEVERYLPHVGTFLEYLEAGKSPEQANLKLENKSTANLCNNYASYFEQYGQYAKAEKYLVFLNHICEQNANFHIDFLGASLNNLAEIRRIQGKFVEAEVFYKKSLVITIKEYGQNHETTATAYNNLGLLYKSQDRYKDAESLYLKALAIRETIFGENHKDTAQSYNNLATLYFVQRKYKESELLGIKALAIREQVLPKDHPKIAESCDNLALTYIAQSRFDDAEPLVKKAVRIYEKVLGENHPDTATSYNNLAGLYESQGRYTEAEPLNLKALAIRESELGENHPDTATSYNNLGVFCANQEKFAEAKVWLKKALVIRQNVLGNEHPYTIETRQSLENVKKRLGE